jgi:hypothetical protein
MTARSLRGGTLNCKAGRDPRDVKIAVSGILADHDLDFLLVQESAGYVAKLATIPGYRLIIHDVCGTGILARELVEAKFAHVAPLGILRWPFAKGGRPVRWHPRRALCAVLLDGWLHAASIHCVPDPDHNLIRRREYNVGMRRLVRWANNRQGHPLVIAGDWNKPGRDTATHSPQWVAEQIGAELEFIPGHVDYPMWRKCDVDGLRAVDEGGSDHALVLFTVTRKAAS